MVDFLYNKTKVVGKTCKQHVKVVGKTCNQHAKVVEKTFIIEQFCKENYESYYINFDLSPTLKEIFNGDLDANTLIMKSERYIK